MGSKTLRCRTGVYSLAAAAFVGAVAFSTGSPTQQEQQETEIEIEIESSSVNMSSQAASLTVELSDGAMHTISLEDGTLRIDGESRGSYEPGGVLDQAWRSLLRDPAVFAPGSLVAALREWEAPATENPATSEALREAIDRLVEPTPADVEELVTVEGPNGDGVSIAPGRLSFTELTAQLERLHTSLERLGEEAEGADEQLALVVHDNYEIPADKTITGNLALLNGELRLGGRVAGYVLVADGTLLLEPTAVIEGDVLQVGGEVLQRGGRLEGELLAVRPLDPGNAPAATDRDAASSRDRVERTASRIARVHRNGQASGGFASAWRNIDQAAGGLATTIGWLIALGLAGMVSVYFARPKLETIADTARQNLGRSFAVGLAGEVLFFPVTLVLAVAIITWLIIPFYMVAVALALLAGYLAVAHVAGEIIASRRYRTEWLERLRHSNSYYFVLSGLVLLLLPFGVAALLHLFGGPLAFLRGMMIAAAVITTWAAVTLGFGAVILSRAGTRTDYASGFAAPPAGRYAGEEDVA